MTAGYFTAQDVADACVLYVNKTMTIPDKGVVVAAAAEKVWADLNKGQGAKVHGVVMEPRWAINFGDYIQQFPATVEKVRACVTDFTAGYVAATAAVAAKEQVAIEAALAKKLARCKAAEAGPVLKDITARVIERQQRKGGAS
jgi:hypothetical protein